MSFSGRQESASWPSRRPVWKLAAAVGAVVFMVLGTAAQVKLLWTPLQRFYLSQYLSSFPAGIRLTPNAHWNLVEIEDARGTRRLALDEDVSARDVVTTDGRHATAFDVAESARQRGMRRVVLTGWLWRNNVATRALIRHWIYGDQSLIERTPWRIALGILVVGLVAGYFKDRQRLEDRRAGRAIRGPELVSVSTFNRLVKGDGIGFAQRSAWQRLLRLAPPVVRLPRESEPSHMVFAGDTGAGKGQLLLQLLWQIEQRGEMAIVYDPALELTPRFYGNPRRSDVILNPLDARMPYWSPGDELEHEAEAATIAKALFPEAPKDNPFFVDGSREIFAHLLTYRPTPQELTHWLATPSEIDHRVRGTGMALLIDPSAAPQRAGILASLNRVSKSLKLLPTREEGNGTWSALEWSKDPGGWIFVTSTPETRDPLRPLCTVWLDMLILRLMNQERRNGQRVWIILDELASLERLPQLHTALTEGRKSGNPVVLGFQGRGQVRAIYGDYAEPMLSQPATKVFMMTKDPDAAEWASRSIGRREVERVRESRSEGHQRFQRESQNDMLDRSMDPLVMDSEIMGLDRLIGYLKFKNYVVRLELPILDRAKRCAGFIMRRAAGPVPPAPETLASVLKLPPPAGPAPMVPMPPPAPPSTLPPTTSSNEQTPFFE